MTLLVTVERYQVATGDTTSAASAVSARLEDAQGLLADALGRSTIVLGEITETLPVSSAGVVYPSVVPVVTAPEGASYVAGAFEGITWDSSPFAAWRVPTATVTYTAGWDDTTVPTSVAVDLAWCAWRILNPTAPAPAGATAVANGDASMSFSGASTGSAVDDAGWSKATLRWRRRRL